ncbi:MAG: hypothetical protein FJ270_00775 [Planctomycetes bacterium]|nr:hypothetical protein [Planctomycetota bacterium]
MRLILFPIALLAGCVHTVDLARATRPYPVGRVQSSVEQMQVVQEDLAIRITNGTAVAYDNASLWVNRRFVKDNVTIPAGGTVTIQLADLRDQWGEQPYPRALFRARQPTTIVLAQLEAAPEQPLVGLVVVTPRVDALR